MHETNNLQIPFCTCAQDFLTLSQAISNTYILPRRAGRHCCTV